MFDSDTVVALTEGVGYIKFPEDKGVNSRYRGKTCHFVLSLPYPIEPDFKNARLELDGVEVRGRLKSNTIYSILEQKEKLERAHYTIAE